MQEFWDAHCLPALHEARRHVIVLLRSLGLDVHPVAEDVYDVERVEPAITLDISGTDEIGLMNVVDARRFREVGIFDSLGNV